MRSCKTCVFSGLIMKGTNPGVMICRLRPPTTTSFVTERGLQTMSTWPAVAENDWCGEHRPIVEGQA